MAASAREEGRPSGALLLRRRSGLRGGTGPRRHGEEVVAHAVPEGRTLQRMMMDLHHFIVVRLQDGEAAAACIDLVWVKLPGGAGEIDVGDRSQ